MSPEHAFDIARELERQPLARMQAFAELLGWRGLKLFGHRIPEELGGYVVIFYMTSDWKFNLQINAQPHRQTRMFAAAVKAHRYHLAALPFQPFELFDDDARLVAEAERLAPLFSRRNFKNRDWRRRFATEHPELVLPVRRRRKGE